MTQKTRYQDLIEKVEAKALEFHERYKAELACRKGCSSCCLPGLSVFSVERKAIQEWLEARPELMAELQSEESSQTACAFLDQDGACRIYPVRPIICRTQGLPLSFKVEDRPNRDVCPLNLVETDLWTLPTDGLLNLDLLNTLLVLVDQVEGGDQAGQRFPLNPQGILGL